MANYNKHTGPNVPALRFPEFSGEWEKMSLQDCCSDFSYGLNAPAKAYDGVNKYIRITDIDENTSVYKSDDPVSPDGLLSDEYLVNENDILFARTGASTGKTYLYNQNDGRLFYAGFLIKANVNNNCDPYFIFSQTKTQSYRRWVEIMSTRSGQPGINSQEYASYPLYVPSKEEQEKIALLLRGLDKRILVQSKIIEELTALRSALTEKCSRQAGTLFSLADILEETDERSTVVNQHQVLSSTVKGIFSQKEYFNKDIASEDNKGYKVVRRGNVVLSPQNLWMGNINYNNRYDVGIVSPSYKIYSIKKGFNPTFIAALLKSKKALYEYMLASEQGASVVRRNLNVEAFMGITFRIPNAYQQEVLSKAIAAIDLKLSNELAIFEQLQLQKGSLLENMFI